MGDRAITEDEVEIAAELAHELDADGEQLRVVKLPDYTAEKVRTLCASPDEQAVPARIAPKFGVSAEIIAKRLRVDKLWPPD